MKISVKNLSKSYNSRKPRCKFIGGLFGIRDPKYALKNINLEISSGECVGIIGANGSGKSTLLKLISGITAPTYGEVSVNGKISALLELGSGFNPEYTGISNIYLNGAIQGLTKAQTKALIPEISSFADIGEYIEKPVKTYSDGMFLRLAFACAVATSPDILIVDEALAVGDFAFRQKCFSKINSLKQSGTTVIMVSHDIDSIRRFCSRAIWLDKGELRMDGDIVTVSAKYMESMTGCVGEILAPLDINNDSCINRFGSAVGSILSVTAPKTQQTGEKTEFVCRLNIPENADVRTIAFSISIKNSFGLDLTVISTADSCFRFSSHGPATVKFIFDCLLCGGEYSICASLEDRSTVPIRYYDYAEGIGSFRVISDTDCFGVYHAPVQIEIEEGESLGEQN